MSNEGMMFMIDQAKKILGPDIQYIVPWRRAAGCSAIRL